MKERVLDRLVISLAATLIGVVVFVVVLALVPESPQRIVAGIVAAVVGFVGVLGMPLLLDFLVHRTPPVEEDPYTLRDQRAALVRGLVDLLPQLPDGLVWQAENALTKVGVHPVVPDGEPVDPGRHHVVGTEPPLDTALVNTVARTIRPGYADGDRLVSHPKVVVYTMDPER